MILFLLACTKYEKNSGWLNTTTGYGSQQSYMSSQRHYSLQLCVLMNTFVLPYSKSSQFASSLHSPLLLLSIKCSELIGWKKFFRKFIILQMNLTHKLPLLLNPMNMSLIVIVGFSSLCNLKICL